MTNTELDNIYKQNIGESHYAALRGVWNAGYQTGTGTPLVVDETQIVTTQNDTVPAENIA